VVSSCERESVRMLLLDNSRLLFPGLLVVEPSASRHRLRLTNRLKNFMLMPKKGRVMMMPKSVSAVIAKGLCSTDSYGTPKLKRQDLVERRFWCRNSGGIKVQRTQVRHLYVFLSL